MQLTKFQMAAVKRTAQNTKRLVIGAERLEAKMRDLAKQLVALQKQIDVWEEPIRVMTGGYTSAKVLELNGNIPDEVNNPCCDELTECSSPFHKEYYESADFAEAKDTQLN